MRKALSPRTPRARMRPNGAAASQPRAERGTSAALGLHPSHSHTTTKDKPSTLAPSHASGCIRSSIGGYQLLTSPIPIRNIALASLPETGARCGNTARRDLCGGCRVTGSPTATSHDPDFGRRKQLICCLSRCLICGTRLRNKGKC